MKKILGCVAFVMGIAGITEINPMSYGMMDTSFPYDAVIEANQDLFYDALDVAGRPIMFNNLHVKILPIRFFHNKTSDDERYRHDALIELIPHLPKNLLQTGQLIEKEKPVTKSASKKRSKQSKATPQFDVSSLMKIPPKVFGLLDVILCRRPNFFPCNVDISELLEFVRRYNTTQLAQKTGEVKLLVFDLAWESQGVLESDLSHMFAHHVAPSSSNLHQSYFIFPTDLDLSRDSQRIMTTMLLIGLEEQSLTGSGIEFKPIKKTIPSYCIPIDSMKLLPCEVTAQGGKNKPFAEIIQSTLAIMKIYIR